MYVMVIIIKLLLIFVTAIITDDNLNALSKKGKSIAPLTVFYVHENMKLYHPIFSAASGCKTNSFTTFQI